MAKGWVPSNGPVKSLLSNQITPKLISNPEVLTMPCYFRAEGLEEEEAIAEKKELKLESSH